MNNSSFNSVSLNSVGGKGEKSCVFSVDARVASLVNKPFGVDALLRATFIKTFGIDGILQGGSTKFFSIDAVLTSPFKDNGAFYQAVGDNISVPMDDNKLSSWSTYSRPQNPTMFQCGINVQTGKIEYWNGSNWKNYDGSSV